MQLAGVKGLFPLYYFPTGMLCKCQKTKTALTIKLRRFCSYESEISSVNLIILVRSIFKMERLP